MKIASLTAGGRGETDRLLTELATALAAQGLVTSGIVRAPGDQSAFDNGCDMRVQVLPDGPVIAITQPLGPGSNACRLDPAGIAAAVGAVESGGPEAADVFILNKFGPEEAEGRGFREAIAHALERGTPVLVGLGTAAANRAAFDAFTGGLAEALPADPQAILDWCQP